MPEVWPVIHHHDLATSLRNAAVAVDAGCRGVFLIDHDHARHPTSELTDAGDAIRAAHPALGLGVNFLDLPANDALRVAGPWDAVWVDDAGLHSRHKDLLMIAEVGDALSNRAAYFADAVDGPSPEARAREAALPWRFFAGVAFKGQPPEPAPERMAEQAVRFGWVPTTSGPATGVPADLERVTRMAAAARAAGGQLALASGLTPENAAAYRAHIDVALVSTGVSSDFHTFDPARLAQLVAALGD